MSVEPRPHTAGFTMIEIVVVIVVLAVALGLSMGSFLEYSQRNTARRAAQIFARDLSLARTSAARAREEVVIRFYETGRWYSVTTASGRELTRRRFNLGGDMPLTAISLALPGDSLVFSRRGVADLSALDSPLGQASFSTPGSSFTVRFNSLGASKVTAN